MRPISDTDERHLKRALDLAEGGRGLVHPNPVVGCVLVRDGKVVGEGFHPTHGGPHAEIVALEAAGERARGGTAYVSLEPCAHAGKTPPCTEALRDAGVRRVVYAAGDPGPGSGGGARLRAWGLEVTGPTSAEDEVARQNAAFFRIHRDGLPYVALKLALSLDGRIAAAPGQRTALTGAAAGRRVHALRREFDGILVGTTTAVVDDPLLTVRDDAPVPRPPARVLLDRIASISPEARVFRDVDSVPVHLFVGPESSSARRDALSNAGARVHVVPTVSGGLDLPAVLDVLWQSDIRAVLCEGGGELGAALLRQDLVQRLYLFLAPRVLGPSGVLGFPDVRAFADPEGWTPHADVETLGADVLITYDYRGSDRP
jgi:diaminohydroxyphosphoribosylaminopyrimidine deaminase/5-amino-6-(5-phosphoribosylamino)uracil reductase